VQGALADLASAKVSEKLRAMLEVLAKVTRDHTSVTADDMRALLAVGVTRSQIEDALMVSWCFNVITRLADTFEFHVGPQSAFDSSAKMLLSRGYKI
jgi:alkylhydroperoxidase family enzyme